MSKIYVVGHKNPDTDSIVSAMAYAALRNASGDRDYEAARLDHINDETRRILEKFNFEAPERIVDVRTQVKDIDFDTPSTLDPFVTLDHAWHIMNKEGTNTIPVVNSDGTIYGTLSSGDIASYTMSTIDNNYIEDLPLFNLLGVIEGKIIHDGGSMIDSISGELVVALPLGDDISLFSKKETIVLCGNQPDMIRRALEMKVNTLILCGTSADQSLLKEFPDSNTLVIYTPLDAVSISKHIFQAAPIARACSTGDLVCFHLDDYIDDVKEIVLKSRFRSYPVLDENNKVVGTLSRYHLLRPRRKKVVLVDHNESAQAVPGLDQAELMEIIDHHRLADIQTTQPISVRNVPVGSTTTIVAEMYQEHGVTPPPAMAGLMVAAILSDTVMFKSPTCTQRDIAIAERLSRIARVSIDKIGEILFNSEALESKPVTELIKSDFKEFHIAEQTLGVSQITCVDSSKMLNRKGEFLNAMSAMKAEHKYDLVLLMLTDVLVEGTVLLYIGNEDTIRFAFSVEPSENELFLPGVMSRKKQIIPMLTALWG